MTIFYTIASAMLMSSHVSATSNIQRLPSVRVQAESVVDKSKTMIGKIVNKANGLLNMTFFGQLALEDMSWLRVFILSSTNIVFTSFKACIFAWATLWVTAEFCMDYGVEFAIPGGPTAEGAGTRRRGLIIDV